MRQFFTRKSFILGLAALSLVILFLLASALNNLEFQAGRPLGQSRAWSFELSFRRAIQDVNVIPIWKKIVFWLLLFLLVWLVSLLLTPESRKRLLQMFLGLVISFWVISYLLENQLLELPALVIGSGGNPDAAAGVDVPPLPAFTPPDIPNWMNYLISLGVVLALLFLTWSLRRWWMRLNSPDSSPDTLKDLASVARSSLRDLSDGADWADAITNCYVRMSEVVSRTRGLSRQAAMTPAEFAHRLERAGLPSDPVRRLTRLFEAVRYGAHKPTRNEINEAIACLNSILHYCGEEV